ncbi:MAG TPA: S53 family peptidase [Terriglobales bacterium]|nr:S53 family peptidase [Terriglobales bacterium]
MQNQNWRFLNKVIAGAAVAVLVVSFSTFAAAQEGSTGRASQQVLVPRAPQNGKVFTPDSDKASAGFAHTTYLLHSADGNKPAALSVPTIVDPSITYEQTTETPNSMGCIYVGSPKTSGCIPNVTGGGPSAAGYGAIAIVDAYDNPDAATDVAVFNAQWPLAATSFTKIYANGNGDCTTPPANAGWALEEALDIEWSHVFAPNAAIILVEACSSSYTDLFYAEQVAFNYIVDNYPAGGQVTNSWQGGEFSGQISDDPFFADWEYVGATGFVTHIQAFASSGDGGYEGATTGYPSGSPWVVSAGGTSVYRSTKNAHYSYQGCWSGSGGGVSAEETYITTAGVGFTGGNMGPWANFQFPIFGRGNRVTPDLSFNADPNSGVYVYDEYNGGWFQVGGTSVSSPSLASIINRANNRLGTVFLTAITGDGDWFNTEENNLIYSQLATNTAYAANFYDVTKGSNGGPAVVKSYDECTGVGAPIGLLGK